MAIFTGEPFHRERKTLSHGCTPAPRCLQALYHPGTLPGPRRTSAGDQSAGVAGGQSLRSPRAPDGQRSGVAGCVGNSPLGWSGHFSGGRGNRAGAPRWGFADAASCGQRGVPPWGVPARSRPEEFQCAASGGEQALKGCEPEGQQKAVPPGTTGLTRLTGVWIDHQ